MSSDETKTCADNHLPVCRASAFYETYRCSKGPVDSTLYRFEKLGLVLVCQNGTFNRVGFDINTSAVRGGDSAPYKGVLPFGITTADTRTQVKFKLGIEPCRSTEEQDRYSVPPFRYTFTFRSADGSMDMVGVSLVANAVQLPR